MSARMTILSLFGASLISACQASQPPLKTVPSVDLEKFMGDWYVIANIPTFLEKDAHNAVETYRLDDDGTIATTFTFRDGSFNGAEKKYNPRGFVLNSDTNAEWGMQFIWPFKGDYRIIFLDDDYSTTIIGRDKRDYVWLMARNPELPFDQYEKAVKFIVDAGYDRSQLQRVPQRW
jgi:apolipoprotein D and lipocalin family protein